MPHGAIGRYLVQMRSPNPALRAFNRFLEPMLPGLAVGVTQLAQVRTRARSRPGGSVRPSVEMGEKERRVYGVAGFVLTMRGSVPSRRRASLASVAKRLTQAISPSSLVAVTTPQPRSTSRLGASADDALGEFELEVVDGAGELTHATQSVPRDADARGCAGARQASGDTRLPAGHGERERRDLEPEVVQVPAQVVAECVRCATSRSR